MDLDWISDEIIRVKSLETLIEENGDSGKQITYLKLDIEGTEINCMKKWLQSGVMKYVEQLGNCLSYFKCNFFNQNEQD